MCFWEELVVVVRCRRGVCVCVCVKGAMNSRLEGSVRLDQERFRTRDECESGGNEWDGDTYVETRLTFWKL